MKRLLLILLCLVTATTARMSLQVDKERVEAGKTFKLMLIVPLQELPAERGIPQLETRNGFSFLGLDSSEQVIRPGFEDVFSSFFGGGGRPYRARIYTFNVRAPKKTGSLDVGQIEWKIDGNVHTISGNIPINIQRAYSDEALSVSLTPSKKSIYEGEQFYVTLGFHTYEHFEGGLQATDMSTGNDFIVHYGDLSTMEFKPVEGARREMQASAKFAWLSPTKNGTLRIPPFKFKYTKRGEPKIVEEKKQMGGMSFHSQSIKQESIEAETQTPTVNITVKPLPAQGKPENFSGMVGDYKFNADFDRTNLKVGEALTLSINIKGDGTPGTVTDPKLPDFSEFRSVPPENNISKKITGNKVITSKDIKVFLYPKKKGTFEIPAINYSWFNPAKKKYETATAGPWTIEVEKGDGAESVFQGAMAGSGPVTIQKQEIESLGNDIRFIHLATTNASSPAPYKTIFFWALFATAIPFYFVAVLSVRIHRKHRSDAALIRKGRANKQLREKFATARKALESGDGKAFFAALENGLMNYLSDLTNLEFRGMTLPQMKEELAKLGVKDENIAAIGNWLEKCAFVRYAPVTASKDEQKQMLAEVEKLCENLKI